MTRNVLRTASLATAALLAIIALVLASRATGQTSSGSATVTPGACPVRNSHKTFESVSHHFEGRAVRESEIRDVENNPRFVQYNTQ